MWMVSVEYMVTGGPTSSRLLSITVVRWNFGRCPFPPFFDDDADVNEEKSDGAWTYNEKESGKMNFFAVRSV